MWPLELQASALNMSSLLKDLEALRKGGASVADREQRLDEGSADLQSLLQAIRLASDKNASA